jgi:hypothetical protein
MRARAGAIILSLGLAAASLLAAGQAASGCVFNSADDCLLTLGYGCTSGASSSGSSSTSSSTGSGAGGMGGTTSTGGTGGTAPECTSVNLSACGDVPPGPCATLGKKVCTAGKCGIAYTPGDAPSQQYGSCKKTKCDASGLETYETFDMNVYDDGNPCTQETCTNGVPSQTQLTNMACMSGATSGTCLADPYNAGLIVCSECQPPGISTCIGGAICVKGKCVPPHCANNMQDQGETAIDCGGATSGCLKCTATNSTCLSPLDCASGLCSANKCVAASCTDSKQNQNETDVDCGGGTCPNACDDGLKCIAGTDCKSGVCKPSATMGMPNTCQVPTCTDGVKNGDEADVDCGGPVSMCPPCAPP